MTLATTTAPFRALLLGCGDPRCKRSLDSVYDGLTKLNASLAGDFAALNGDEEARLRYEPYRTIRLGASVYLSKGDLEEMEIAVRSGSVNLVLALNHMGHKGTPGCAAFKDRYTRAAVAMKEHLDGTTPGETKYMQCCEYTEHRASLEDMAVRLEGMAESGMPVPRYVGLLMRHDKTGGQVTTETICRSEEIPELSELALPSGAMLVPPIERNQWPSDPCDHHRAIVGRVRP